MSYMRANGSLDPTAISSGRVGLIAMHLASLDVATCVFKLMMILEQRLFW